MGRGARYDPVVSLNMAPFVGILLALVIVVIGTIPERKYAVMTESPIVDFPFQGYRRDFNLVDIDPMSNIYWNQEEVDLATLQARIKRAALRPEQPELWLRPHGLARFDVVGQVMATAQRAGAAKLAFVGNEAYAQ